MTDTDRTQVPSQAQIPSVSQAIALREQAPELYDLWLKVAQEKASTANYVDRAPLARWSSSCRSAPTWPGWAGQARTSRA
jgi:hypothetical protein